MTFFNCSFNKNYIESSICTLRPISVSKALLTFVLKVSKPVRNPQVSVRIFKYIVHFKFCRHVLYCIQNGEGKK